LRWFGTHAGLRRTSRVGGRTNVGEEGRSSVPNAQPEGRDAAERRLVFEADHGSDKPFRQLGSQFDEGVRVAHGRLSVW
jgi:hypothetical protein